MPVNCIYLHYIHNNLYHRVVTNYKIDHNHMCYHSQVQPLVSIQKPQPIHVVTETLQMQHTQILKHISSNNIIYNKTISYLSMIRFWKRMIIKDYLSIKLLGNYVEIKMNNFGGGANCENTHTLNSCILFDLSLLHFYKM